jgi:hypothetical protein
VILAQLMKPGSGQMLPDSNLDTQSRRRNGFQRTPMAGQSSNNIMDFVKSLF